MDFQRLLQVSGACRTGHFVLASGWHSGMFCDFEVLFKPENERHLDDVVAYMVALIYGNSSLWPDVIVGPANGGNKLCECLAPDLSEALGYEIKVVLTEKIRLDGADNFGFQDRDLRLDGRRVLVIDDVLTKGRSTGQVVNIARVIGAEILGIVVAVDREGLTSQQLQVPLYRYLIALKTNGYDVPKQGRRACPFCMDNVPIDTTVGHGAAEVAKYGQPASLECGD